MLLELAKVLSHALSVEKWTSVGNRRSSANAALLAAAGATETGVAGSASAGNVSSGAEVVLHLSSGSGLGGTLTVLRSAVLGLGLIVVRLSDGDGTADIEGSLGEGALLGLSVTAALGLADLSLVGDGVLVGDDDLLSTDLGLGASGLGGELGISTSSLGTGEDGVGTRGAATTIAVSGTRLVVGGATARIAAGLDGHAIAVVLDTLEGSGGGNTEESNNSELHLFLNVIDY